ncbi:hypothetical protein L484_001819 [Morus notabilis]|uniref:Uncharacterized protein n=1 Tax=Morus notabilis TaxID=981085 RepID=W9R502_9ROSA|nr:hypothetical protein L484_001819 [Morus notabilis]
MKFIVEFLVVLEQDQQDLRERDQGVQIEYRKGKTEKRARREQRREREENDERSEDHFLSCIALQTKMQLISQSEIGDH